MRSVSDGKKTGKMPGKFFQSRSVFFEARRSEQGFRRRHDVGSEREQGIGYVGCLIEVDDDRNFPLAGGAAHRGHEFRKTVIDENGVDIGDQCRGIVRQCAAEVDAAARGNGFFARSVEQNERDRRRATVDAHRARAIDILVAEIGQEFDCSPHHQCRRAARRRRRAPSTARSQPLHLPRILRR